MAAKKEATKIVKKQEVKYTLAISMLNFKKGQEVKPTDFTEYSFKHWLAKGAIIKK
jgi:hypothetical protein